MRHASNVCLNKHSDLEKEGRVGSENIIPRITMSKYIILAVTVSNQIHILKEKSARTRSDIDHRKTYTVGNGQIN